MPPRQFTLPYTWPENGQQEHENWVALERWANTYGQTPYDAPFFDKVCDGTLATYTFNVPNLYTHLWYEICVADTVSGDNLQIQFNGDTTAGDYFDALVLYAYNTADINVSSTNSFPRLGTPDGTTRPLVSRGVIGNYNTLQPKIVSINYYCPSAVAFTANGWGSGLWTPATQAKITSITLVLGGGLIRSGSTIKFGGIW